MDYISLFGRSIECVYSEKEKYKIIIKDLNILGIFHSTLYCIVMPSVKILHFFLKKLK